MATCTSTRQSLCGSRECETCFKRSFASEKKAEEWNHQLNGNADPWTTFRSCAKKVWFTCKDCAHDYGSTLNNVSNGGGCPFCANQKLCGDQICVSCYEKSLASTNVTNWNRERNGDTTPLLVFKGSRRSFYFDCSDCGHTYLSRPASHVGCSFCANKVLCDDGDCKICFFKSFASVEKSALWSATNELTPRRVFKNSQKKALFHCETCPHEFESPIVRVTTGGWCPHCAEYNSKLCDNFECEFCFCLSRTCGNMGLREKQRDTARSEHQSSGKILAKMQKVQTFVQHCD